MRYSVSLLRKYNSFFLYKILSYGYSFGGEMVNNVAIFSIKLDKYYFKIRIVKNCVVEEIFHSKKDYKIKFPYNKTLFAATKYKYKIKKI